MFKILGRTSGNVVDVAVDGKLTARDFAALRDEIAPLVEQHGKFRLMFDLSRIEGFEAVGLWDEQSFEPGGRVERSAIVVASEHADRAAKVFALGADASRVFEPERAEEAWQWLTRPSA